MVTNVHITRILEKTTANDFPYEVDTFKNEVLASTDCPDYYPAQTLSSWTSLLTEQQSVHPISPDSNVRKYPIRIFTIQPDA